jgi:hypothetical protein
MHAENLLPDVLCMGSNPNHRSFRTDSPIFWLFAICSLVIIVLVQILLHTNEKGDLSGVLSHVCEYNTCAWYRSDRVLVALQIQLVIISENACVALPKCSESRLGSSPNQRFTGLRCVFLKIPSVICPWIKVLVQTSWRIKDRDQGTAPSAVLPVDVVEVRGSPCRDRVSGARALEQMCAGM